MYQNFVTSTFSVVIFLQTTFKAFGIEAITAEFIMCDRSFWIIKIARLISNE